MRLARSAVDRFQALRKRIIRETEVALLIGLTHPERMQRIPIMEIGTGQFDPTFAARFWESVLDIDSTNDCFPTCDWPPADRLVASVQPTRAGPNG